MGTKVSRLYQATTIMPGQVVWVSTGWYYDIVDSAISVSAVPYGLTADAGGYHTLEVFNINISNLTEIPEEGDPINFWFWIGFNVKNNGYNPVHHWSALIGAILP